ncbi:MAG: nucleotidyltransferase family protein [Bacteroidales bacterium]|jgi:NDP-sugar pyrophosphorylase family protein|nr:nucleotidyltransferase family protein [Bacteroidales bacterium]
MKAMIFAAGLGSRLKPITDSKPKALVKFNGITLLEYAIYKLKHYGITEIVINVHHFSEQIIDFVSHNNFGIPIHISDESEQLLNTGGGLLFAQKYFSDNSPFIVYNVDIISTINLQELYDYHVKEDALITLAVKDRETSRYLLFDENLELCAWENRETHEQKIIRSCKEYIARAFSGIQIINPDFFNLIYETGSFSIMDIYLRLAKENSIKAFNHTEDFWLDVGKFNEIKHVEQLLATQPLEFLPNESVQLEH